jgi:uncharacterized damage-inducible protein DinB
MRKPQVVLTASALLTALALAAPGARAQGAPAGFREEFLHQFDNSMAKVVELAQAVPIEKFAWGPEAGVMPLARLYAHIARFNYHYPATAMGVAPPAGVDPDTLERVAGKAQVVALLRRSAEHVRQAVRRMPEGQLGRTTTLYGRRVPQWAVLFQLLAHMNDHMGQSIAYARVNGVVPPWSQ